MTELRLISMCTDSTTERTENRTINLSPYNQQQYTEYNSFFNTRYPSQNKTHTPCVWGPETSRNTPKSYEELSPFTPPFGEHLNLQTSQSNTTNSPNKDLHTHAQHCFENSLCNKTVWNHQLSHVMYKLVD